MKYCSKCGNELFDEAVICPKCGCAVNTIATKETNNKKDKIYTAFILSVIAIVIAVVSSFTLIAISRTDESFEKKGNVIEVMEALEEAEKNAEANRNMIIIFGGIAVLAACSFGFNLTTYLKLKKGAKATTFARVNFTVSIIVDVIYMMLSPIIFIYFICGVGMLIPVAPILQTIAASKLLKASKE